MWRIKEKKNKHPDYYYYDTTIRMSDLEFPIPLIPFDFPSQIQVQEEEKPLLQVNLGEKIGICAVCRLALYELEEFIKCPSCFTLAHKSDFLEWIKVKGVCPACGINLKFIDFKLHNMESQ